MIISSLLPQAPQYFYDSRQVMFIKAPLGVETQGCRREGKEKGSVVTARRILPEEKARRRRGLRPRRRHQGPSLGR